MPRYQRTSVPGHLKSGRPEHAPTAKTKSDVANYAATGYGHEAIASAIGISVPTLYKYYRHELDFAEMEALGFTRRKLNQAIAKGEGWAIKYHLETKGRALGWSPRMEHTGADGAPLFDYSNLSDQELIALRTLVSKTAPTIN